MKKRGVYILLAIVLIINLTACGTGRPEAGAANAFVEKEMVRGPEIEKTDVKLEEILADKNEMTGVTAEDMEQLYAYANALADWAPVKEECDSVPLENWIDYMLLSNPVELDEDTRTYFRELTQNLEEMEVKDNPIYFMPVYNMLWQLKNAFFIDGYTIADFNALEPIVGEDYFIYYGRRAIYKYWEQGYNGRFSDYDRNMIILDQSDNKVVLKIEFVDESGEEMDPFYVKAHLVRSEDLRYWAFDYWGNDSSFASDMTSIALDQGESDTAWKEAYKEFLLTYSDERYSQYEWLHPHFDLIYIDGDEVPELAIINYGSHADGVKLYTYYEGEVVWLGEYGEFGGVYYATKDNIIASYTSASGWGVSDTAYYKIENGKDIFLADISCYSNAYMLDAEPDTELFEEYYIGKQQVSKSEYQAKADSYEKGKAFSYTSYDLTYRITEETIQLLFMDIKDESW